MVNLERQNPDTTRDELRRVRSRLLGAAIGLLCFFATNARVNAVVDSSLSQRVDETIEITGGGLDGVAVFTPGVFVHGRGIVYSAKTKDGVQCSVIANPNLPLWGFVPLFNPFFSRDSTVIDTSDCD